MKRQQYPTLGKPLIFFMAAGLLWIISGYTEPRLLTSIVYLFMFGACGGLILSGLDYLTFTVARDSQDFPDIHRAAYRAILREENLKLSLAGKTRQRPDCGVGQVYRVNRDDPWHRHDPVAVPDYRRPQD